MCFIMTATTVKQPFISVIDYKKNPKALTYKEQVEHNKNVAKLLGKVLEKTGLGKSLEMLAEYAHPKPLFERMFEEDFNRKNL